MAATRRTSVGPSIPIGHTRTQAAASHGRRRRATRSASSGTSSHSAGSARVRRLGCMGSGTSLAGSGRRSRPQAGCDPGDMVVSDLEPAVPRGGLRRHVLRCGQLRARTESDARSDSASPSSARAAARRTATFPGWVYRSQDFSVAYAGGYLWKGSLLYVTGAHSVKIGYQHTLMTDDRTWYTNNQNLTYRVDNGEPDQLTQSISPWVNNARNAWDGLFVQEQWTHRRVTLQGALRFDRARSWFPAQQEGPSRFLPTPIIIPETRGVDSYKDFTPRDWRCLRPVRYRSGPYSRPASAGTSRAPACRATMRTATPRFECRNDVCVRPRGRDTCVDRRQSQLGARLRSAGPGRTGSPRERR